MRMRILTLVGRDVLMSIARPSFPRVVLVHFPDHQKSAVRDLRGIVGNCRLSPFGEKSHLVQVTREGTGTRVKVDRENTENQRNSFCSTKMLAFWTASDMYLRYLPRGPLDRQTAVDELSPSQADPGKSNRRSVTAAEPGFDGWLPGIERRAG